MKCLQLPSTSTHKQRSSHAVQAQRTEALAGLKSGKYRVPVATVT